MHFIVFSLSILIALFFISGYSDAAKPPNSLKSKAKQNQSREPRIKLYERTLRKHLASDSYPLIDLEVSLDQVEKRSATHRGHGPRRRSAGRRHLDE